MPLFPVLYMQACICAYVNYVHVYVYILFICAEVTRGRVWKALMFYYISLQLFARNITLLYIFRLRKHNGYVVKNTRA